MIRDVLLPKLETRFANRGFQRRDEGNAIGIFPAAHEQVGDLAIFDDGDEVTIYVGQITHLHLDLESSNDDRAEEEIANEVISFLEELFADKMVIWKSKTTGEDGVMPRENAFDSSSFSQPALTYVWSGPVRYPKIAG